MQQYREAGVTVGTTPTQIVAYDPTRLVLILSLQTAAMACHVAANTSTLAGLSGSGILLGTTLPIILTRERHGIAVVQGWWGTVSGGSAIVYAGEVYDLDEPWSGGRSAAAGLVMPAPEPPDGVNTGPGIDSPDPIQPLVQRLAQSAGKLQ